MDMEVYACAVVYAGTNASAYKMQANCNFMLTSHKMCSAAMQ